MTSVVNSDKILTDCVKKIIRGYTGGPVCIIGIVTSVLSLILFKRDTSTTLSTRLLLSAIALVDIIFLLMYFILNSLQWFLPEINEFLTKPMVFTFFFFMTNVFELYRNWLVVVIAVERLLYFLKPVEFKVIWSVKKVAIVLIFLCVFSCLIRIPVIIYGIAKKPQERRRDTDLVKLTLMIHLLTDCIVLTIAPVLLMILLSIATTIRINAVVKTKLRLVNSNFTQQRRSSPILQPLNNGDQQNQKEQDDNSYRKHYRIVKILHTVLITFIICSVPSIPATIMSFYLYFHDLQRGQLFVITEVLSSIANLGSLFNSTSNFFVYVAHSKRYRYILAKILMLDRCFASLHREPSSTQETCCNLQEEGKTQFPHSVNNHSNIT
ncbi:unnamed protein product [Hymenolepis diminuta]|uniref:G_PROTEIN_RECEP_F1_2 domain-containing protein n=1 Tax=Hymenolepis diminuta TaxID=6216 RepID=A0A0R3STV8_HYMDI|nr:unnamed protein product [Hymenolepis diminuta]VUZ41656.1 unnamed protein product [Hymenolepis diminuta]